MRLPIPRFTRDAELQIQERESAAAAGEQQHAAPTDEQPHEHVSGAHSPGSELPDWRETVKHQPGAHHHAQ